MTYYKAFDSDLKNNYGVQFEVGKVYDTGHADSEVRMFESTVYHFCSKLEDLLYHYQKFYRICEIEPLGKVEIAPHVCCSNKIRIVREFTENEIELLLGLRNGNSGYFNTGEKNSGNFNSGNNNSGSYNTGHENSGCFNTMDGNSGTLNSGRHNIGSGNSGDMNSGDFNSGNKNFGNWNSGDFNLGCKNAGNWNFSDRNSGFFNTLPSRVVIFDKPTDMSWEEVHGSKWYKIVQRLSFASKDVSSMEQILDEYDIKELNNIPNFDAEKFKLCTGWDIKTGTRE